MARHMHTPGTWEVVKGTNYKGEVTSVGSVRSQDGWYIAKIEDLPEAEANGVLLAAAPIMLEALEDIAQWGGSRKCTAIAQRAIAIATARLDTKDAHAIEIFKRMTPEDRAKLVKWLEGLPDRSKSND